MLLVSLYLYEQTNFRLLYFRFTLFLIPPDDGRVSYIQVIVYHLYFLSNKKSICFFRGIVFLRALPPLSPYFFTGLLVPNLQNEQCFMHHFLTIFLTVLCDAVHFLCISSAFYGIYFEYFIRNCIDSWLYEGVYGSAHEFVCSARQIFWWASYFPLNLIINASDAVIQLLMNIPHSFLPRNFRFQDFLWDLLILC